MKNEKYINVVYIWRKFVLFYGYVHWRMTTEISVMYGSEKVSENSVNFLRLIVLQNVPSSCDQGVVSNTL